MNEKFGGDKTYLAADEPVSGGISSDQPSDDIEEEKTEKNTFNPVIEKALREGYFKNFDEVSEKYQESYSVEAIKQNCDKIGELEESFRQISQDFVNFSDDQYEDFNRRIEEIIGLMTEIFDRNLSLFTDIKSKSMSRVQELQYKLASDSEINSVVPKEEIDKVFALEFSVSEPLKNILVGDMLTQTFRGSLEKTADYAKNPANSKRSIIREYLDSLQSHMNQAVPVVKCGIDTFRLVSDVSKKKEKALKMGKFETGEFKPEFDKKFNEILSQFSSQCEKKRRIEGNEYWITRYKEEAMGEIDKIKDLLKPEEKVLFDYGYYIDKIETIAQKSLR